MWPRWISSNLFCMAAFSVWLNTSSLTTPAISLIVYSSFSLQMPYTMSSSTSTPSSGLVSLAGNVSHPSVSRRNHSSTPSLLLPSSPIKRASFNSITNKTCRRNALPPLSAPPSFQTDPIPHPSFEAPSHIRGATSSARACNFPPITASMPAILNAFDKVPTAVSHALAAAHTPLTMSSSIAASTTYFAVVYSDNMPIQTTSLAPKTGEKNSGISYLPPMTSVAPCHLDRTLLDR